jgi:hypothetical protein
MQASCLALVGLIAGAGEPDQPESDWLTLDREITALVQEQAASDGPYVGGVFKFNYANSDELIPPGSTNQLGGFVFDNLRFSIEGRAGDFDYLVQYEAAAFGTATSPFNIDAWVRTYLTEHMRVTIGNQLRPFLGTALVEPQNMLFILRTTDGQFWHSRDQAVKLDGAYEFGLAWALSLENGADGAGDEAAYTARLAYHALGGGVAEIEGALGTGEHTRLTVAAAFHDDANAVGDGEVVALEAMLARDRLWLQGEWLDYADDGGGGAGIYSAASDTSPFSVAGSFMFIPDKYEAAVRYQYLDDTIETDAITIGVNRYELGRDVMWQLNWVEVSADSPGIDTQTIALGLTIHI